MKRWLGLGAKLAALGLLVWYVLSQVQLQELSQHFRTLQWNWLFAAAGFWCILLILVTLRWQILLASAGVPLSFERALRYCFVGYFFNNVLPGLTGGDVVRAVLVARGRQDRRLRAAVSVFVDRVFGLLGLLLLGGSMLLLTPWNEQLGGQWKNAPLAVGVLLLALIGGGILILSRRLRQRFRLDRLLQKFPFASQREALDDALLVYRPHAPRLLLVLALSILLQGFAMLSFWAVGQSLSSELPLRLVAAIFPVAQTLSSVPVAPGNWGVGETIYGHFFQSMGATFTLGVAVSVLFRLLTQVGFGLLGGLAWFGLRRQSSSQDELS